MHIVSYFKGRHKSLLALDPIHPTIDHKNINDNDWAVFYGDVKEVIPPNSPTPLGKSVDLRMMVDGNPARENLTRQSHTKFLIFCNMVLINWLSKMHRTMEITMFGAEFVAMKHGVETLHGIWYKLSIISVPIKCPRYIYGDNMYVIYNTLRPESMLRKRSKTICYPFVRESVVEKELLTSHIPTLKNLSELFNKLMYGQKYQTLVKGLLCDIYDHDLDD